MDSVLIGNADMVLEGEANTIACAWQTQLKKRWARGEKDTNPQFLSLSHHSGACHARWSLTLSMPNLAKSKFQPNV